MQEIKCPKCNAVFQVDEAGYAAIVKQVRDREFNAEVTKRTQLAVAEAQAIKNEEIAAKNNEITKLQGDLREKEKDVALRVERALQAKEKEIGELQNKLNNAASDKENAVTQAKKDNEIALGNKDKEIIALQGKVDAAQKDAAAQISDAKRENEAKISELTSQLHAKEIEYDRELQRKNDEIRMLADYRARLSTKMLGEDLEQHCAAEFEKVRSLLPSNVEFEKDNDPSSGTKGDFIYRETDENGIELLSIMFEMKNENNTSKTKQKNALHFQTLDKNRREKKCEYAILVSMLEENSEIYNAGIVDVSNVYPKMYVIRPQFFIPIITLLHNVALNGAAIRAEVARLREEHIDVVNFRDNLATFKGDIKKNYDKASGKFAEAVKRIDESIAALQKTKENLLSSENNLRLLAEKTEKNLTIKRLTKNSPLIKAQFDALDNDK